jgi:A/G-specific adenine glycosylase
MTLPARALEADFIAEFRGKLLAWQAAHGRHHLPWQLKPEPYRVWVSEIMLQQTQVSTVLKYYERFLKRFPTPLALAQASDDEVTQAWAGLGYYRRARMLHQAAKLIERNGGDLPTTQDAWSALPGIGRSTAAAIISLAQNQPAAILDGNVKRVLARLFAIEQSPEQTHVSKALWSLAERLACDDPQNPEPSTYTQGMMDLGALVCTAQNPSCASCPVDQLCAAKAQGLAQSLPIRKRPRAVPVRKCVFLELRNAAEQILLIKRAPVGVWPGLFCLPEFATRADIAAEFGSQVPRLRKISSFQHRFTHFLLHAEVLQGQLKADGSLNEMPSQWLNLGADPETWPGLPTPIARWLKSRASLK